MVRVGELILEQSALLNHIDFPLREARILFSHASNMSISQIITGANNEVSPTIELEFRKMISRRLLNEPVAYIVGKKEFMGLVLSIGSGVLIPRADTETLVDYIINNSNGSEKILEFCTGSGCISISLAHYLKNVRITAEDVSEIAINMAIANAKKHKVDHQIKFELHDIFEYKNYDETYDIIVSNPPYIKSEIIPTLMDEVKKYEPSIALDGGEDGLKFYRQIIKRSGQLLNKGGLLALEIGMGQCDDVIGLLDKLYDVKVIKDISGIERVIVAKKIILGE